MHCKTVKGGNKTASMATNNLTRLKLKIFEATLRVGTPFPYLMKYFEMFYCHSHQSAWFAAATAALHFVPSWTECSKMNN